MPSAFVTGGTGFIGSHLVEELLRRGYDDVRCLVRTDRKWLADLPIEEIRGDLFDDALIAEAVSGVDYVYHNAGVTRAKSWAEFRRSNVDSTTRLLRRVADVNPGVRRVLITSSLAAVGRCNGRVATEESPLKPVSMYGRSKAEMETAAKEFSDDLPMVVVRPPSVYGPREADIYTFFKTLQRRICPVVGPVNRPVLSLVYVDDLVRGMVDAAESPEAAGETYFIGSEAHYSWNDVKEAGTRALGHGAVTVAVPQGFVGVVGAVVEAVSGLTGAYPPLNREKAREIVHACKMCSVSKAKRELGYEQQVPLQEGVSKTIAWYKQEGWL